MFKYFSALLYPDIRKGRPRTIGTQRHPLLLLYYYWKIDENSPRFFQSPGAAIMVV